jgi:hypothetical protein
MDADDWSPTIARNGREDTAKFFSHGVLVIKYQVDKMTSELPIAVFTPEEIAARRCRPQRGRTGQDSKRIDRRSNLVFDHDHLY